MAGSFRLGVVEKLRMGVDNGAFFICKKRCPIPGAFCATEWDTRLSRDYAGAPKRTETSLDTPGSCMVTP